MLTSKALLSIALSVFLVNTSQAADAPKAVKAPVAAASAKPPAVSPAKPAAATTAKSAAAPAAATTAKPAIAAKPAPASAAASGAKPLAAPAPVSTAKQPGGDAKAAAASEKSVAGEDEGKSSGDKKNPDLAKWITDFENQSINSVKKDGKKNFFGLRHVIFLKEQAKGKGLPKFVDFDSRAFNASSYVYSYDARSVDWTYKLNTIPDPEKENVWKPTVGTSIPDIMQSLDTDILVLADPKKKWEVYYREEKDKAPAKVAAAGLPEKGVNPHALQDWLGKTLGYDGVVLSRRGNFLLVGSFFPLPETKPQALLMEESTNKLYMPKAERKGVALLQLVQTQAGYGLFQIILIQDKSAPITLGSLVQIERTK